MSNSRAILKKGVLILLSVLGIIYLIIMWFFAGLSLIDGNRNLPGVITFVGLPALLGTLVAWLIVKKLIRLFRDYRSGNKKAWIYFYSLLASITFIALCVYIKFWIPLIFSR